MDETAPTRLAEESDDPKSLKSIAATEPPISLLPDPTSTEGPCGEEIIPAPSEIKRRLQPGESVAQLAIREDDPFLCVYALEPGEAFRCTQNEFTKLSQMLVEAYKEIGDDDSIPMLVLDLPELDLDLPELEFDNDGNPLPRETSRVLQRQPSTQGIASERASAKGKPHSPAPKARPLTRQTSWEQPARLPGESNIELMEERKRRNPRKANEFLESKEHDRLDKRRKLDDGRKPPNRRNSATSPTEAALRKLSKKALKDRADLTPEQRHEYSNQDDDEAERAYLIKIILSKERTRTTVVQDDVDEEEPASGEDESAGSDDGAKRQRLNKGGRSAKAKSNASKGGRPSKASAAVRAIEVDDELEEGLMMRGDGTLVRANGRPVRQCTLNRQQYASEPPLSAAEKKKRDGMQREAKRKAELERAQQREAQQRAAKDAARQERHNTFKAAKEQEERGRASSVASKASSAASKGSRSSGGGKGRGKSSKKHPVEEEPFSAPASAGKIKGIDPESSAPTVAAPTPTASEASAGADQLLYTQQAKDKLQNKIDMLNDVQLEQVLDFLEADLTAENADPDEEIQLDLDKLPLRKMVQLVQLIDEILEKENPVTAGAAPLPNDQVAGAAATASAQAAAADEAAMEIHPDHPPTDAIQNHFLSPSGDTPLASPRLAAAGLAPGPSPRTSAVGVWSEFSARAMQQERHLEEAASRIAETAGTTTSAAASAPPPASQVSAAPAPIPVPAGSDSMLHDAAEIVGMMND